MHVGFLYMVENMDPHGSQVLGLKSYGHLNENIWLAAFYV